MIAAVQPIKVFMTQSEASSHHADERWTFTIHFWRAKIEWQWSALKRIKYATVGVATGHMC